MLARTPYGRLKVQRQKGDILQPKLMSRETLEAFRRATTS